MFESRYCRGTSLIRLPLVYATTTACVSAQLIADEEEAISRRCAMEDCVEREREKEARASYYAE